MESKSPPRKASDHTDPPHISGARKTGSCTRGREERLAKYEDAFNKYIKEVLSYLLQSHAPHTVLPTPVRASGAQTEAAVMQTVAGWRARQWGRRLHLHWRDVEQGVAETRPVIGGVHAQDAPRLTWENHNADVFFSET